MGGQAAQRLGSTGIRPQPCKTEGIGVRHTSWARFSTLAVAVLFSASIATAAAANPNNDQAAYPSQDQVRDAEQAVTSKRSEVAAIESRLRQANQRLDDISERAEQAAEDYNAARWQLEQAKSALKQAEADSERARKNLDSQRAGISALVTQSYMNGGGLQAVEAFISTDGPEAVMNKYLAYQGASTSMEATYQRFQASKAVLQTFEDQKRAAAQEQERLTAEERTRAQAAQALADEAVAVAAQVEVEREQAVEELARAQNISVSLARERQTALEEIARQKREAEARRKAEAAAKKAAEEDARRRAAEAAAQKAAQAAAEKARKEAEQASRDKSTGSGNSSGGSSSGGSSGGSDDSDSTPSTPSTPSAPSAPSGSAAKAIAFATAQLGDMYLWGAAGPDRWDCSGLTMKAWAAAGVSLPHYSVAQYHATKRVSVGNLKPGDLVFYGRSSSPSSIHHVALYVGDGRILHAPRSGKPVQYASMYYSSSSVMFFGRV